MIPEFLAAALIASIVALAVLVMLPGADARPRVHAWGTALGACALIVAGLVWGHVV